MSDQIIHYGVKGMKWGTRKGDAMLSRMTGYKPHDETKEEKAAFKAYKKSTSRSERKKDRQEAINERALYIMDAAMKKPTSFMIVGTPGYSTMMSGREFAKHLESGGSFNPMTTTLPDIKLK